MASLPEIPPQLEVANVVVTSDTLVPAAISQLSLVRNGILAETDAGHGNVFADTVVQVNTPEFVLTVVKSTMQLAPVLPGAPMGLIADKLGKILAGLPMATYSSFALNFAWYYFPEGAENRGWTHHHFKRTGTPPYSFFETEDARYGAYMSKTFEGLRFKLDVKPVAHTVGGKPRCGIEFLFNCEADLAAEAAQPAGTAVPDPVEKIITALRQWDLYKAEAEKIVHATVGAAK
jgi:hypothetical protein